MPTGLPTYSGFLAIDVRSPGEWETGHLPATINLPILNNQERHLVGIEYKKAGQEAAIRLGNELVDPHRQTRVSQWTQAVRAMGPRGGIVLCWRGGLRSQTAAAWLEKDSGIEVATVAGGYKAVRHELLQALVLPQELLIISGATGSGKTELIEALPSIWSRQGRQMRAVDLEGLARHRGSAFGLRVGELQPSQATFENGLGLAWWLGAATGGGGPSTLVLEDESRLIGQRVIPAPIKQKMTESPVVIVEAPIEERVERLLGEYVQQPLDNGISGADLSAHLVSRLETVRRKLGGLEADETRKTLERAFIEQSLELHRCWIRRLLTSYYDRLYQHSFDRQTRSVIYRGSLKECLQWLRR